MAPATKKAPAKRAPAASATTSKRKRVEDAPALAPKKQKSLHGAIINAAPTQRLNVFVFGEGSSGEIGLGTAKNAIDVKRPRLNPNLAAEKVGVVQVVAGGMHCIALTYDGKILTWGVNDQGALGRDTTWEGGLRDVDASEDSDSDDDEDDNGLNPRESLPGEVDWSKVQLPPGTQFTQVAAGDSCSFALTNDGKVYGWGTFRSNDGIFGFVEPNEVAYRPKLVPNLKNITSITCGANHAFAITKDGAVFSWGSGQQSQLGRRVIERTKTSGLVPREFGLPKGKKGIVSVHTGNDHAFAISKTGEVWAWGLNNFCETAIKDHAGEDGGIIITPRVVAALKGKEIVSIKGGTHHSIAATKNGDCLVWGRLDGNQMGIPQSELEKLPEDALIRDESNKPRIVSIPQKVNAIKGAVSYVTASSEHNIAITKEGKAWSWGFSGNYQTGQGTDDDIEVATMIDNTAVREKKLN